MRRILLSLLVINLLCIGFSDVHAKIGFTGDPAAKRGLAIGYDEGRKQGRADKASGQTYNATKQSAYLNPAQFYRSEYGRAEIFLAAFRRGFLAGYRSSYSGNKGIQSGSEHEAQKAPSSINQREPDTSKKLNPVAKPSHKVNVYEDAL